MPSAPPPSDLPRIEGYELEWLLGRGGCGAVFLAVQTSLARRVALKVLLPEHLVHAPDRRRFRREARLLARLQHPHVMRVLGASEEPPWPYIALEYLPAGTLRQRLDRTRDEGRRGLGVEAVSRLARELLDALATLHEADILHRDIKPANVLFRDTGEAVLSDLGIAKIDSREVTAMTATGQLIGTLAYLPPECYQATAPGVRGDLFALGVLLYEALVGAHPTGFRPFSVHAQVPDAAQAVSSCPPQLAALVRALIATDPARRPASAEAALAMLGPVSRMTTAPLRDLEAEDDADQETAPSSGAVARTPSRRLSPRGSLRWVLAVLTAAGGALLAALHLRPQPLLVPGERVVLELVGLDGRGAGLGAWLSAQPPIQVLCEKAAPIQVGHAPVRVPAPQARMLALRLPGGLRTDLALAIPADRLAPPGPRFPELGVTAALVPAIPRVGTAAGAPLLTEWAVREGLGWLGSVPDAHGKTLLTPELFAWLGARGVRPLAVLRVGGPPGATGLEEPLRAVARAEGPHPIVTLQEGPFDVDEDEAWRWSEVPAQLPAWAELLRDRCPGLEVVAPPVWALLGVRAPGPTATAFGPPELVLMSHIHDVGDHWAAQVAALRRALGQRFDPQRVRWAWVAYYLTALEKAGESWTNAIDRPSPMAAARSFVLARRHFPAATVLFDQRCLLHWITHEEVPAWRCLVATAERLAGTVFASETAHGQGVQELVFRGPDRTVRVLMAQNPRLRALTWVPPRPGMLALLDEDGARQTRLVTDARPISIPLGVAPVFFEELATLRATCEGLQIVSTSR